ncbi:hypothetical protein EVAR_46982_1 [Eumeta japonica]|uniref:Uncharacterized protein n=1 Tax=Eumeta variegata TaxID=151549 RepID=A0A4C1X7A0_EUMVA|nr:hypothetical protein EVAR_46982_1 [Eumeta japonica]
MILEQNAGGMKLHVPAGRAVELRLVSFQVLTSDSEFLYVFRFELCGADVYVCVSDALDRYRSVNRPRPSLGVKVKSWVAALSGPEKLDGPEKLRHSLTCRQQVSETRRQSEQSVINGYFSAPLRRRRPPQPALPVDRISEMTSFPRRNIFRVRSGNSVGPGPRF